VAAGPSDVVAAKIPAADKHEIEAFARETDRTISWALRRIVREWAARRRWERAEHEAPADERQVVSR
jgi:hypothetical protein